ncbi:MAG: response regulator [Myxococcaceae bacterium]|nr:response regulator [Myxococcaceae bacterium]
MSSARDKLLGQFRELVIERLEKIGKNVMKLEGAPDPEAGKAALRELHGLKGEARMMGFADVNTLVHEMEELVRAPERAGYALQPQSTDALLVASDAVTVMSGAGQGAAVDLPRLLEWLKQRTEAEKALHPAAEPPAATQVSAPRASPGAHVIVPDAPRPSAPAAQPPRPGTSPGMQPPPAAQAKAEPKLEASVIRISQGSLETLTSTVTGLLQRNRRRELSAQRGLRLARELSQLHRMAEDMGPAAAALATRLQKAKEVAAELQRDGKLLANEEVRDLTQLSEEVQTMRMLPLAVLFEPYPRMVRELARELGKEVELTVEGEDTRVDRSVLEALKDPLMHLVRNALDHGLEPREERVDTSKSPRGHLTLSARREGERLVLRVEDDGRGLDPGRLRAAAVRKGLIEHDEAQALSDEAARDLIFLPGFTSKEAATELSGRGVGLDVVRVRMVGLGGEATVESQVGRGSAFELRVPVSLTVAPLLFVEVGTERLCITAANVDRALKIEAAAARELAGRPAVVVDDLLVPFASISSILGAAPERPPADGELVLVVKGRGQSAAIAVDRVLEERVQAVLPLKGVLSGFQHLSGATALADGSLAMVLSAAHLVATAQGQRARLATVSGQAAQKKRRIMVVDDSPLTRELLSGLLEAVGFEIINANDGAEALERLAREVVDLVVTDLEMPRVDGLELTRRLKSHPTLRSLPVVIVTTRGSEADKKRGMEAGADGYVTKGDLVRQDLVDVVSRLLV